MANDNIRDIAQDYKDYLEMLRTASVWSTDPYWDGEEPEDGYEYEPSIEDFFLNNSLGWRLLQNDDGEYIGADFTICWAGVTMTKAYIRGNRGSLSVAGVVGYVEIEIPREVVDGFNEIGRQLVSPY